MKNLKRIRKQRGMTQKELGDRVGVSESMIGMIEKGVRNPSLEVMLKIGEALDCTSEELLYGEKNTAIDNDDGDKLDSKKTISDRDMRLLSWFRSLPPEKQQAILIAQDAPTDLF